ncbi:MAG: hypothetical protein KDK40_03335, partial [Chlamydiia bacterium]|nr:hypothetical protein [Chlamydiia bacterium]
SQKQVTTDDFSLQDFYSLITIDHDQLRTAVSRSLETRRISSVDGLCTALYSEKCKPSDPQHHLEYWSNLQIPQNLTLETLTNHLQNFRLPPPAIQNPHLKDCFTEMDNAIRHSIYSLPQNRQFATFCSWVHKLPEVAREMVQNPRNAQQIAETYRGVYDVSTWRTPWAVIKDEYRALYYTTRLEKLFSLYIAAESTHRYGVPIGGITTFSLLLSPTRSLALMGFLYLPVANFFLINGCDLLSGYVTDGPNPCSAFFDKLTTDLKTSLHPITYFLLSWGTVAAFSPAFQRGFFGTLSTISSPALIGTATKRFITESPPVQYACSLGRVFYKLGSAVIGGGRGAINAWKGA